MATQEDKRMMSWFDYFRNAMQPPQLPQKPNYTQNSPTNDFGYTLGQAVGAALFGERTPKADNYDPSALTDSLDNSSMPQFTNSKTGQSVSWGTANDLTRGGNASVTSELNPSIVNALNNPNIQGYGNNLTQTSGAGTYNSMGDLANNNPMTTEQMQDLIKRFGRR